MPALLQDSQLYEGYVVNRSLENMTTEEAKATEEMIKIAELKMIKIQ